MTGTHKAIKRAFEARRKNQEALVELYDGAENRDLTADEKAKEGAIVADLRDLSDRESELVELAEKEARSAEYFADSAMAGVGEGKREEEKRHLGQVLKDIANGDQRGANVELRDDVALVAGTATDGAELVETELSKNLVDYLQVGGAYLLLLS